MSGEIITQAAGSAPGGAYYFDELEVGMRAEYTREVTMDGILMFAVISGDNNPVHLDEEFAAEHTPFGDTIAHGLLTASYLSTVLGTRLPGPGAIYINQSVKFRSPVHVGDQVTAVVEVEELIEDKKFIVLHTQCLVGDKVVLEGKATLMPPNSPA